MAIMDASTKRRWFHPTPGRFVFTLLAVEVLLWLSERFGWLGWHKGYAVLACVASVGVAMLVMAMWFGVAVVFRRRFQFSLRTLLALVVVVALPCSWMAVEMKKAREQNAAVAAIVMTQGDVMYDDVSWGRKKLGSRLGWGLAGKPSASEWQLWLFGHDFVANVAAATMGSNSRDSDLECLGGLPGIVAVHLNRTSVTDRALEHVKGLANVKMLDLEGTQVTDDGLHHLIDLTELRQLDLSGTKVTAEGVAKLQQALPNCKIEHLR